MTPKSCQKCKIEDHFCKMCSYDTLSPSSATPGYRWQNNAQVCLILMLVINLSPIKSVTTGHCHIRISGHVHYFVLIHYAVVTAICKHVSCIVVYKWWGMMRYRLHHANSSVSCYSKLTCCQNQQLERIIFGHISNIYWWFRMYHTFIC